jgi:mono/diheme cytochrome c family protein
MILPCVLLALAGCKSSSDKTGSSGGAVTASSTDKAEAKTIYEQRCVVCHGATGKGDGAGAANLNPKPRSFGDAAWQKSVEDESIRKVIVGGGPAIGKNAIMPPNPDLKQKAGVVQGLLEIVRGFGK